MNIIFENKANELFAAYLDAELKGNDILADDLEKQLNDGGWLISGSSVKRKVNTLPDVDPAYMPTESKVTPYAGKDKETKTNYGFWFWFGISASILAFILTVIYLIKRFRNAST